MWWLCSCVSLTTVSKPGGHPVVSLCGCVSSVGVIVPCVWDSERMPVKFCSWTVWVVKELRSSDEQHKVMPVTDKCSGGNTRGQQDRVTEGPGHSLSLGS